MRSYLLLESVTKFPKYACFCDTEMPLRLKLGSVIIVVHLHLKSIKKSMKHPILKVFLVVVMLLVQLMASIYSEINSGIACISEIPLPQPFFKLSITELTFIP